MSNALDRLRKRAAERPRATLALVGGIGCAVLLVVLLLASGGDDVAAVVSPGAATPGTATPAANGSATSSGTTVAAATPGAAPGSPATTPAAATPDGSGTSAGSTPAAQDAPSPRAIDAAKHVEQEMNAGLPSGPRTPRLGTPVATSTPVAAAGARLERIAADYTACLPTAKDHYDCLAKIPAGIKTERIYDSPPYGVLIALTADDGTTVRLSIRGPELCRMLAVGSSCDAWSSAG